MKTLEWVKEHIDEVEYYNFGLVTEDTFDEDFYGDWS